MLNNIPTERKNVIRTIIVDYATNKQLEYFHDERVPVEKIKDTQVIGELTIYWVLKQWQYVKVQNYK